jgi:hypothetical protein
VERRKIEAGKLLIKERHDKYPTPRREKEGNEKWKGKRIGNVMVSPGIQLGFR